MLELIELTETPDHQSLQNKINNHVRYLESYGDEGEFADLSNLKIENFDFSKMPLLPVRLVWFCVQRFCVYEHRF